MTSPFSESSGRTIPTWTGETVAASAFSDSGSRETPTWTVPAALSQVFYPQNPFGTFTYDMGYGSGGYGDLPYGQGAFGSVTYTTTWTAVTTK